ncbi:hypothetical protein ACT1U9_01970 [Streptomyces sp. BR1]|uniref:hypothetical protein n=1 Tax=Streptomyces sp. BR1 TaxID=1592323 RepID=UPI00402BD55C
MTQRETIQSIQTSRLGEVERAAEEASAAIANVVSAWVDRRDDDVIPHAMDAQRAVDGLSATLKALVSVPPRCEGPNCGTPVTQTPGGGRVRRFCGATCRQRARRSRAR